MLRDVSTCFDLSALLLDSTQLRASQQLPRQKIGLNIFDMLPCTLQPKEVTEDTEERKFNAGVGIKCRVIHSTHYFLSGVAFNRLAWLGVKQSNAAHDVGQASIEFGKEVAYDMLVIKKSNWLRRLDAIPQRVWRWITIHRVMDHTAGLRMQV
jgi:hypothetical protein